MTWLLFQMMVSHNTQEHTIEQFIALVDGTGWKLVSISRKFQDAMAFLIFDALNV